MERERGSKVIAIVALCVGVVGLSLGFAAFSSNLTIKSSAQVNPTDTFTVTFDDESIVATPANGAVAGDPEAKTTTTTQGGQTLESSTIGDLSATFTAPGQSVTYTFDAVNGGSYVAYLTDVVFANVTDGNAFKVCTAGENTTEAYVNGENGACNDITLTLTVDGEEVTAEAFENSIAIGGKAVYQVVIAYEQKTGQQLVDGSFSVAFGDIQLTYGSVANQ